MQRRMNKYSSLMMYERAAVIRDQLEHIQNN